MPKFFIYTKFHEYKKRPLFGKPIDTIEPISVGIVSEDYQYGCEEMLGTDQKHTKGEVKKGAREYYAICKDFDLKAAWNSWQWELEKPEDSRQRKFKVYWLRDNVLKPIIKDFAKRELNTESFPDSWYSLKSLKYIINKYGKTKEQIADEVREFVSPTHLFYQNEKYKIDEKQYNNPLYDPGIGNINVYSNVSEDLGKTIKIDDCVFDNPEFYGYMCGYDLVVMEQLFGGMKGWPLGFPYYIKDLKQTLDEKRTKNPIMLDLSTMPNGESIDEFLLKNADKIGYNDLTKHSNYPKLKNEHNALSDAQWAKELYDFLNTL